MDTTSLNRGNFGDHYLNIGVSSKEVPPVDSCSNRPKYMSLEGQCILGGALTYWDFPRSREVAMSLLTPILTLVVSRFSDLG